MESGIPDERPYWVAFLTVPYVGPARMRRLLECFGSLEVAWKQDAATLKPLLDERGLQGLLDTRRTLDPMRMMESFEKQQIRVTTLNDPEYPRLLQEIPAPPPVLFHLGEFHDLDAQSVAIVGTRRMSAYGRELTARIAGDLARAGVTIVSGLARGVDGVAHRAALDAGGRTIAVLGGGLNRMYPAEHTGLARQISESGVVMSEYLPDTTASARHFPARNRIISGLSLGIVVTEAPERSGALITVDFAADQGRDVFAVPGNVGLSNSAGCLNLLRDGARLVRSAEDVLEDLRIGAATPAPVEIQQQLVMNEDQRRLLAVMSSSPHHIDDLAAEANLPVWQVSVLLMTMELQGMVRNAGAQHYLRL